MAFANSQISDVIATTIQRRSGKLADNVTNNNALLFKLKMRGRVQSFSGGNVILEEIMYNDAATNNVNSYSGAEVINTGANSPISAFQFPIAQYAGAVSVTGLEILQNSGKEQIIDLLEGRVQLTEAQLMSRIDADLYGDGTGNGGKNITGLAIHIADSPTTGVIGGVDRAIWTFARNGTFDATTDGGAPADVTNIQRYMNLVSTARVRGKNRPDLIIADGNYYNHYLGSLQARQFITDETMAGAGFTSLKYFGAGNAADVVLGGGIGGTIAANRMYFINTEYQKFRPHSARNFVVIGGERQPVNQDMVVKLIGFAGQLTTCGPQFSAVLKD